MRNHLENLANLKGGSKGPQEDAGKNEWFVAKVIHFDEETREIELLEEEPGHDEESCGQRKYKLPMSHILPFTKRTDLSSAHDFPHGKHVWRYIQKLQIYMKQLLFKLGSYVLEFEHGSLHQRLVPFHRVVPLPEGYRQ